MARMTPVAMLLPGLRVALLLGAAISIVPLARDAWRESTAKDVPCDNQQVNHPLMLPSASLPLANVIATSQNVTSLPPTHANAIAAFLQHGHALNLPLHSLHTLPPVFVLYFVIATLVVLLWGMGVTHTQVRAWVHQQGLAVTAGLMHHGIFPLLHSLVKCACVGMQRTGEVVWTVIASMAGTHEMKEELVMSMRVIAVHLERTRIADMREMIGQVEERGGEMAAELAAVRRELAKQRDIAERREADLRELREEVRMREDEMRAELARKREERREVQEMNWPRAMEELAACKEWQTIQDMKMNIELEIRQSVGDRKKALEAIKAASQETHLNLSDLTCLSDAILTHVSTMTHLKSIDLNNSAFSLRGVGFLRGSP
ncbi:unnamed protein product [Closterium sp. Naga37s-1]|nr:unnamed protein product [Closterium sp. Naga37s-1]